MKPVEILVVDDHPLTRAGIVLVIGKEFPEVRCGEASTLGELQEMLKARAWDFVILDHNLSDGKGIEHLARHPEMPPTLILTMYEDRELSLQARCAGARGFVSKADAPHEIVGAIRTVLVSGVHFPGLEAAPEGLPLSVREQEVLKALLDGRRLVDLSKDWNVTQSTLQSYKKRLYIKYGVDNLADLVRAAVHRGVG
ncbi:MAG: hypothetical protein RL318_473 [Fibrobacterota bacterium]|jgi:DNA-binding NarL/FixJ family response regulator